MSNKKATRGWLFVGVPFGASTFAAVDARPALRERWQVLRRTAGVAVEPVADFAVVTFSKKNVVEEKENGGPRGLPFWLARKT